MRGGGFRENSHDNISITLKIGVPLLHSADLECVDSRHPDPK